MFSQMQNVVSSRELFNSNPCRDIWESQSCSQTASGSQNSQGSYELFSQPLKQTQLKGTAIDRWSQPGGSQQSNEEDPVKYYLKYMTKPSLFGDKDKPGSEKAVNRAASYREHIEIQKKKVTERDERDMLDSFIALLKDYQKEVKSALDSFKTSVDSTLTKKAEQIAAGADQSSELIAKLKEELKEHFLNLRKEMEEHQLLRETIAKQETKIVEQETQIKLLQDQLYDCKEREKSVTLKEQSYLEREKEIHRKLQELERLHPSILRDTPPLSQKLITGNEMRVHAINQSQPDQGSRFSSTVLQHIPPRGLDQVSMIPQASCQPPHLVPSATHTNQEQHQLRPTNGLPLFQSNDVMLPINAQGVVSMQSPTEPLPTHHYDTRYLAVREHEQNSFVAHAKVLPVQQFDVYGGSRCSEVESYTCKKNDQGSAVLSTKAGCQVSRSAAVGGNTFTSPGKNLIPYIRTANWPKQSPVATVYPQVHVKVEESKKKSLTQPCKQKDKAEDPFDIFTFDLTESPEIINKETTESSITQRKSPLRERSTTNNKVEKEVVKTYNTRSRQETSQKFVAGVVENNKTTSKTRNNCEEHTTSTHVPENSSERPLKLAPTRSTNGNHIPAMFQIKSGNVSKKTKPTVFRRTLAEKRKLPTGTSFFDMVDDDDDISIQKITESLRKHTQQRKIRKMIT